MFKSVMIALVGSALALLAVPAAGLAKDGDQPMKKQAKSAPVRTGHVEVRGIDYYYEVHGKGEPLLLLHGGLGTIDMFQPILPALAEHREIIAVDMQGHGRTTLGDRPIRLPAMADDIAAVLREIGYGRVDVLGYSMGGGVALRLAIQHPEVVRRAVFVSTPFAQDGFYPEMLPQQAQVGAAMADMMKDTPMYKSYAAVAPHPEDFPKLLDATGDLMRQPYNWAEEVKTLKMPIMLVYGDADMIRLDHVAEFYHLIGGAQMDAGWMREHMAQNRLAIVPDLTHYEMFTTSRLKGIVLPFIDGISGTKSWAEQIEE
ncbi:MAG: alpha/beta hydrolase [Salaquimonas sp.]|nr:alpha/beta hydrolase [Salaquimonas sp.]